MYDAKSEPNEFVGDNRQEAVSKACRFYAIEESDLKVIDTDEMSVSGLGGRSVIVALPRELVGRRPSGGGGSVMRALTCAMAPVFDLNTSRAIGSYTWDADGAFLPWRL